MSIKLKTMDETVYAETGVIAIFMAVIISILLLTSTTLAARVSVVELNQSSSVDRSEQAYYAAEAGVEEAARRLDINPNASVKQMFPKQYDGSGKLLGDALALVDDNGVGFSNTSPSSLDPILDSTPTINLGQTSWRERKVTDDISAFSGTQIKDETVQFDTTEMCRKVGASKFGTATCPPDAGNPVGADFNNPDIYNNFNGVQYCWTPNIAGSLPSIEVTDVYYPKSGLNSAFNPVRTEKAIIPSGSFSPVGRNNSMIINVTAGTPGQTCLKFTNAGAGNGFQNFRYIFRIKALFPAVGNNQNYSVNYQAKLLESTVYPTAQSLYLPNNSFLIDVIGQSGDIKRRIVARKLRSGRLLGVFDYVIYTGSPTDPLCKNGVDQAEGGYTSDCAPVNVPN